MYYPTGGYTQFDMESHRANDPRIKRDFIENIKSNIYNSKSVYCSTTQEGNESFSFNGDPNTVTQFKVTIYTGGNLPSVNLVVNLKNNQNQTISTQTIPFTDPQSVIYQFSVFNLQKTTYSWNVSVQGAEYFSDYILIEWNEDRSSNPDTTIVHIDNPYVGGLRVKKIAHYDGINQQPALVKEYEYLLSDGITSSGSLGTFRNIPMVCTTILSQFVCRRWMSRQNTELILIMAESQMLL